MQLCLLQPPFVPLDFSLAAVACFRAGDPDHARLGTVHLLRLPINNFCLGGFLGERLDAWRSSRVPLGLLSLFFCHLAFLSLSGHGSRV